MEIFSDYSDILFFFKQMGTFSEIGLLDGLIPGKESALTYASGPGGTYLFTDGILRKHYPDISLLSSERHVNRLRLFPGNDPGATASWVGEIKGLIVYDRMLTFEEVTNSPKRSDDISLKKDDGL